MKTLIFLLFFGIFFSPGVSNTVFASEVEDIEEEEELIIPSAEELEDINQMEVIENVSDTGGIVTLPEGTRQFLTVVTPEGRTYYIIITYDEFGQTVNLLRDLTEHDVEEIANAEPSENMSQSQAEAIMDQNANSNGEIIEEDDDGFQIPVTVYVFIGAIVIVAIVFFYNLKKGGDSDTSY